MLTREPTTNRFTATVLRRSRLVLAALIALVALGGLAAFDLAGRVTESNQYPGLPAWEANNAIHTEFSTGGYERPTVAVVELPAGAAPDDPAVLDGVADATARITEETGARVVGYADDADPVFLSERENRTYLLIFPPYAPAGGMPGSALGEMEEDLGPKVTATLTEALPAGSTVQMTGLDALSQNEDEGGLNVGLKVGIAAALALLVLLWFFRSALAAAPLLIALLAMPIAALGIWAVSLVTTVHETTLMMAPLLAIGIAVDYALIVTSRWREARAAGFEAEDAVREAMRTSGRAIVVSAAAVAAGLATMIVLPIPLLTSLGIGGTVTAAASALVTLTVLPLLLRAAGRRKPPRAQTSEGQGWERLARWSMRRRFTVIAVAGGLLLTLAGVATTINLLTPTTDRLAQRGPAYEALTQLEDAGLSSGVVGAFDVMTPLAAEAETTDALLAVDGVTGVVTSPAAQWRSDDYALLTVIPEAEGGTSEGAETIQDIRDAVPEDVAVGGNAAQQIDYVTATYSAFPWMLALVCLVTFVVVAFAFRSVLLALKALLLNLLSLGAVLGALVILWQWGWGTEAVLGVSPDGSIGTFVPVTVFAFLFGLTMDYEIFLLSRIKEEYDRCGDTQTAVVRALGRTGRLITAAAVILFFSFLSMAMTRELDVAIFASGVALGILLDVTLIRGLLVPALIAAFGRYNWWFPSRRQRSEAIEPEPAGV